MEHSRAPATPIFDLIDASDADAHADLVARLAIFGVDGGKPSLDDLAGLLRANCVAGDGGIVFRADPARRAQAGGALDPDRCHEIEANAPDHGKVGRRSLPDGVQELTTTIDSDPVNGFLWLQMEPGQDPAPMVSRLLAVAAVARLIWQNARDTWHQWLLLRERDHSIRNDLQFITSMLARHAQQAVDPDVRVALQDSHTQIEALIRARRARENGRMDEALRAYCAAMAEPLAQRGITLAFAVCGSDGWLSQRQVDLIGIAVNELVVNAVKHAFPDRATGWVEVRAHIGPARIEIAVRDDGVGWTGGGGAGADDHGLAMIGRLLALADIELTPPVGGDKVFTLTAVRSRVAPERAR